MKPLLGESLHLQLPKLSSPSPTSNFDRLNELSQSVEESGNTDGRGGNAVDGSSTGGGVGIIAIAGLGAGARGARLAVRRLGVGLLLLADRLALDNVVLRHLLEHIALELAAGALNVEATLDILETLHVETE